MIEMLIDGSRLALMLAPLALGVFITFRIYRFVDLTVDGAFTSGAIVAQAAVMAGADPLTAALLGACAGAVAGLLTGLLHAGLGIRPLLAGIIVMTGLYSVNNSLALALGRHGLPPVGQSLRDHAVRLLATAGVANPAIGTRADLLLLGLLAVAVALIVLLLRMAFRTHLGLAAIAAGDNRQAARANGVRVRLMFLLGVFTANTLVAFSGSLFAMDLGRADVSVGVGMVVTGLAAVVIGGALARGQAVGRALPAAVAGMFVTRVIVALLVYFNLPADIQRAATAVVLLAVLLLHARTGGRGMEADA